MGRYLSTSLIFRAIVVLSKYFIASYTYKVICVLTDWCRHSVINQIIVRYLAKNSSTKKSVFFKICSKVFSFFDKLWDKLYVFGTKCGNSSYAITFIKDSFCDTNGFTAFGLLILFFSLGYGVTSLLVGTFNTLQALLMGMGILVSLLLFVGKPKWESCLKSSIFWRFALYIFD